MTPPTPSDLEPLIRAVKHYGDVELRPETRLIEDLYFDSLEVMTLILELERRFELTFADEDLDLDHFETLATIAATIHRYAGPR